MRSIIHTMCVAGIALVLMACASRPSRVEITNALASQLQQIVSDTKALHEDYSRLIDEIDSVIYAIKTIKKHPRFPYLYARIIEANARAFVNPSLQNQLTAQILTSTSGEERAILLKLAEIQEQRNQLAIRIEENQQQSSQLNERWHLVASSVMTTGGIVNLMGISAGSAREVGRCDHFEAIFRP